MWKIFEYICNDESCEAEGQPIELLVEDENINNHSCEKCKGKLYKIISATKGYVKGTRNPVHQ